MDIVIDIRFRNVDEKFIPIEVAIVAINATIIGHWIMMLLCSFSDLPERVRENKVGFRGIIMALSGLTAKPISNISRHNYAKLRGKHATYILKAKKKLVIYAKHSPEMYII